MTSSKPLIKFISIHPKKSIKDVIVDIGKQLKFTKSSFKEINGVFVEYLPTSRYHLHIYSRDVNFSAHLNGIAKSSADENFKTIEICKSNILFVSPPYNNSAYSVKLMRSSDQFYEKVIKFATGPNRSIIDILLLIDVIKHPVHYIVCNRDDSYICFKEGTDAVLAIDLLRSNQIHAIYSNSTAYVEYINERANIAGIIAQRADNNPRININESGIRTSAANRTPRVWHNMRNSTHHNNNWRGTRAVRNPRNNLRINSNNNNHIQDLRHNLNRVNTRYFHHGNFSNRNRGTYMQRHHPQQNQIGRNVNVNIPANIDPSTHNIIFVPKF
ncbi:hypothetical protein ACKWTF_007601 [Chironomus riparius]